ncbi:4'-phosphopantetheinyl transferase [Sphaerotilus sp.]|uniref:4'-phosphopantetheinyl transferase family protein n=1 Tax=Sphaerotilus sp. TaxID=2093942 RepID=UPI0034E1C2EA
MRSVTAALLAQAGHDPAVERQLQALFQPAPHPWPPHLPAEDHSAWTLPLDALAPLLLAEGRLAALVPAVADRWPRTRQVAHAGGRLCAERALAALRGQPAATQAIGRRPDGSAQWPAGWTGSITHDRQSVTAAVAATRRVRGLGIDSEDIPAIGIAADVAAMCCTTRERQALNPPGGLDARRVAVTFAAKEAYYKAVAPRVGRYVDFEEVEVTDIDLDQRRCTVTVNGQRPDLQALAATASARWIEAEGTLHLLLAIG